MKYIEIKDGLSILKENIEAVEETVEGCIVHTSHNSYPSTFPYRSLLELLEIEIKKEEIKPTVPAQIFAG